MISNSTAKLNAQRTLILGMMTDTIRCFMQSEISLKAPESMDLFRELYAEQNATLLHVSTLIERQVKDRSEHDNMLKALLKYKLQAKCNRQNLDSAVKEIKRLRELGSQDINDKLELDLEAADLMETIEDLEEKEQMHIMKDQCLRKSIRMLEKDVALLTEKNGRLGLIVEDRESQIMKAMHDLKALETQNIELQGNNQRYMTEVCDQEAVINRLNNDRSELKTAIKHRNNEIKKLRKLEVEADILRQALNTEKLTNETLSRALADRAETPEPLTTRTDSIEDEQLVEEMIENIKHLFGKDVTITRIDSGRVVGKFGSAA